MKKELMLLFCIGLCLLNTTNLIGQQKPQMEAALQADKEEGPALYKFEPDYLSAEEMRRKEILSMRALIDSMDISEGKRQKLMRDLYRNRDSKRLTKIILANNMFEELEN